MCTSILTSEPFYNKIDTASEPPSIGCEPETHTDADRDLLAAIKKHQVQPYRYIEIKAPSATIQIHRN